MVAILLVLAKGLAKLNDMIFTADGRVYVPGYQKIDEIATSLTPAPKSAHGLLIEEKSWVVIKYIKPFSSFLPLK